MSLTVIIALITTIATAASPWLPVVGPIVQDLWGSFWSWKTKKEQAQSAQNNAVISAEQQHENDGSEIVGMGTSANAQDAALNQLNDDLNNPSKLPVKGAKP